MTDNIEEMVFIKTFGNTALNKVLMFLIDNHLFDHSKSSIAENCRISRVTLDSFFDRLIKLGMVIRTRQIGRATLYKINFNSPIIKQLVKLNEIITDEYAKKIIKKQKIYA